MAAASSSIPFFGSTSSREETQSQMTSTLQQHSSATPSSNTTAAAAAPPPQKKRRNQPGNPNPDAEVIALSPKTLMATNRFICEVCNKGFQREQNLQLHRRGHNLPWKLKQKTTKEPRRKVYLCPEPTCVHHDPSRALGDLTGIKKHFSRKHGEKKWKCEKCSKRYAVQSDWKAHSKTCGTREYRCDCGTLFSRRDSFITHRAFCDALAQESARHPSSLNTMGGQLYGHNHMSLGLSQIPSLQNQTHLPNNMLRLGNAGGAKFEHLITPSNPSSFGSQAMPNSSNFFMRDIANQQGFQDQHQFPSKAALHGLMQLPDLQSNGNNNNSPSSTSAANLFNLSFFSNNSTSSSLTPPDHQFSDGNGGGQGFSMGAADHHNMGSATLPSLYGNSMQHESNIAPHMSATALLQKAAQMGSTTSTESSSLLRGLGNSSTRAAKSGRQLVSAPSTVGVSFSGDHHSSGGEQQHLRSSQQVDNENHLQGLMNSLANGGSSVFGGGGVHGQDHNSFGGFSSGSTGTRVNAMDQQHNNTNYDEAKLHQNLGVNFGGSDKLTLDFLGVGGMVRNMSGGHGYSQRDHHQQHHGINMIGTLDPELKSAQASQPFGGTALQ
ncbi:protein indeterminate-domain 5, chloroplastic-like [Prunus avium]|uniref:Protein indeterminate-domain 5, chloroplastic-like n=1 Tax=Prunus avium TaxID=42229 RepID=A0A6P5SWA4_PRUAV|nr:protein indeterminate-domain 5, chloroplastic-like [Prunus avium]